MLQKGRKLSSWVEVDFTIHVSKTEVFETHGVAVQTGLNAIFLFCLSIAKTVSYTNLTLPTNREVENRCVTGC